LYILFKVSLEIFKIYIGVRRRYQSAGRSRKSTTSVSKMHNLDQCADHY